ncbi:polycomb group RING finger protein 3 isoform X2 [Rhinatrema bivittatum]|uniref:polycomb group RING finger protein 3 isoform X2 n=1 Tax=Rhinatrema bivittatum TaxID=194408 RepID=UPI001127D208|nr:polycomb group RING finger protein 3 isoform X2 [Rhinatrema bivittatum]
MHWPQPRTVAVVTRLKRFWIRLQDLASHACRYSKQAGGDKTPKMLTRKIKLWDINAHITCRLCSGYLIDATTVTECLHTFCRSCLVKYLEENNTCPTCRIVIHQSHPLQYIGHDRTMQDIVYKLVPGLQEAEMRKQREFYHKLGMEVPGEIKGETYITKQHTDAHRNGDTKADDNANKETTEEKQEDDHDYHRSDEQVSICLECNSSKLRGLKRKWIRCSAQATVLHLKKFIAKKLNLSSFNELDILCNEEILGKDHTLKFVVVTRWRFKLPHPTVTPAQRAALDLLITQEEISLAVASLHLGKLLVPMTILLTFILLFRVL